MWLARAELSFTPTLTLKQLLVTWILRQPTIASDVEGLNAPPPSLKLDISSGEVSRCIDKFPYSDDGPG